MSKETSPVADEKLMRNSALRNYTAGLVEKAVIEIHKSYPDLSPNQITILGTLGVAVSGVLAYLNEVARTDATLTDRLVALGLYGASNLADAADGGMAKLWKKLGLPHDSTKGQLVDVTGDRIQELVIKLVSIATALRKNDNLGALFALYVALTNTLPSLLRALAEAQGKTTKETGNTPFHLLGTRAGRALTNTEIFFPNVKGIPVAKLANGISGVANTLTIIERSKVLFDSKAATPLSTEARQLGRDRAKVLAVIAGVVGIAALGAYSYLKNKKS